MGHREPVEPGARPELGSPAPAAGPDPGTPGERAQLLRTWALEAGFTRAGVARLEPSAQGRHLRRWVERGDHAGMDWIARRLEVREDPSRLLPGARSALCVALQYHPLAGEAEVEGDLWPRVARYARGRDYHDLMGKALKALARRIEEAFPGATTRPYVDTGPILERELAARAGLGVQGKNTNLLHRRWGSYFLLAELLTSLELEPDEPLADLCGRCTRCLDHCPTGALPEPYRLDSRRCISYWTIEHRGAFPEEVRPLIGEWVFGCDICQEVCPYNYKARPGDHARLRLPPERRELDLAGLLALDREAYVARFVRSPMKRPKLAGLKRNAAVVMGNRGNPVYVGALARCLAREEEAVVRRHAAWALGRIGTRQARVVLETRLDSEPDAEVRAEIRRALGGGGCEPAERPAVAGAGRGSPASRTPGPGVDPGVDPGADREADSGSSPR
ncbi:MAG: tRNA epoxyqueuosine(34) reductase QueG [Holophagales bacterium]|nr:tRNA epoxyqueuosine(34) reductase QueG [Holophagales bacterium]